MRHEEIQRMLKKSPFEPFHIYMSDGSGYPVHHPDQVMLTSRSAHVGVGNGTGEHVFQDIVICDLVHVTRLGPTDRTQRRGRRRKQ